MDEDGSGMLVTEDQLWNRSSMTLLPGEYAVLRPEEAFMDNFGDTIRLMNPDGTMIQSVYWISSEPCVSIEPRFGWRPTLSPSPGVENPVPEEWDGSLSIKFSRIMEGLGTSLIESIMILFNFFNSYSFRPQWCTS